MNRFTHVFKLAEGKSESSVRLTSCGSTPSWSEQQPSPAVVTPDIMSIPIVQARNTSVLTKLWAGKFVDTNKTRMEVQLVFVDLIPHVSGNGASPTRLILIRCSINNNDSTVLALAG